ncbi:MAG: hypothetical protein HQ582_25650 [Planctomycetes bacterium]|nr:hypothetical protein [Planctomycetota bacterium]
MIVALFAVFATWAAAGEERAKVSPKYKTLVCPRSPSTGTWAILERDGANRPVEPYLSSLGGGEGGTGAIVSPFFTLSVDAVRFTIRGHDGQGGGREGNSVVLVEEATGKQLAGTLAPGNDALQDRSWDVAQFRGREVRIEVHDQIAEGAFAWIGVGEIDAGPELAVDFSQGMPRNWKVVTPLPEDRTELVTPGIPFLRHPATYSLVPATGVVEIPCGFSAERLFFLGGTVAGGRPPDVCGSIEIVYRDGPVERYPLTIGYTLDRELKLLSTSPAIHLHPSGDPFQHYLVLGPREAVIEKIRLRSAADSEAVPRVTAITCQTAATTATLKPLPNRAIDAEETAWIESHTIQGKAVHLRKSGVN